MGVVVEEGALAAEGARLRKSKASLVVEVGFAGDAAAAAAFIPPSISPNRDIITSLSPPICFPPCGALAAGGA
jgi:hypothetical protein